MTYCLSNNCTKNYYNRTLTVQVIVEDVVTWIFLRHSIYAHVFSVLAGIIPLSLRNGGAFDTVCPLVCKWGQLPPLPPPAPPVRRLCLIDSRTAVE